MNRNFVLAVAVVVAVASIGFAVYSNQQAQLGSATVNYYSSLNQARLYNAQESLLQDITNVRNTLASNATSVSWNPGAVTSSSVATTTVGLPTGYSVGDVVFATFSTSTADLTGRVLVLSVTPNQEGTAL